MHHFSMQIRHKYFLQITVTLVHHPRSEPSALIFSLSLLTVLCWGCTSVSTIFFKQMNVCLSFDHSSLQSAASDISRFCLSGILSILGSLLSFRWPSCRVGKFHALTTWAINWLVGWLVRGTYLPNISWIIKVHYNERHPVPSLSYMPSLICTCALSVYLPYLTLHNWSSG